MAIKRVKIDTWDGGIINSDRSVNFTDGAAMVKNFDIYSDNKKLIPLPTFDVWVNDTERFYNLTALDFDASTTSDDTVFATGRYIKNWISPNYPYRVALTPNTTNVVANGEQMGLDLSRLGSDFWDNVTIDGQYADITVSVVANGAHKPIPFHTIALDETEQKGWLFFNYVAPSYEGIDNTSTIYLYWGSGTLDSSQRNYTNSFGSRSAYNATTVYHLHDVGTSAQNVTPTTPSFPEPEELQLTENTSYLQLEYLNIDGVTDGVIGTWAHNSGTGTISVTSDNDSATNDYPGSDNQISMMFSVYMTAYPTTTQVIENIGNSKAYVQITNTGTVQFVADRDGDSPLTVNSASPLSLNTFYRIRCEYEDDSHMNMWVNGALSTAGTVPVVDIEPWELPAVEMTFTNTVYVQNVITSSLTSEDGVLALQDYKILKENENCYTIGTVEEFTSITPTYGGLTIYSKTLSATEWTQEQQANSIPLQIDSNTPVDDNSQPITVSDPALIPTFISYDGTATLGKKFALVFVDGIQANVGTASRYIMVINNEDLALPIAGVQLPSNFIISSFSNAGVIPNAGQSIANVFYLSALGSTLYSYDGGDIASAFSAYPTVTSIDNYSGYLAIGGFRDNRSFVQLWDRSSSTASQFIDFGVGWLKAMGVVKGNLVAVVDGFIDNTAKSVSKPYIEIRRWTGSTTYDTPARIELPANYTTGFDEEYLSPVYNKKAYSKNAMLFYAKIPTDDTLTTFHEGFWAVGVNERTGKVALSIMYDTDGSGKILDYTSVANNVMYSSDTGEVFKLTSGNYSRTSLWESLKFEGDVVGTQKKLHAVEISTEPLDTDQEVTLYYKRSSDTSWVKIGTMTATNSTNGVFKDFIRSESGSFPNFRSIQFRIESKNGSAPIVELALRYEELLTKV